MVSVTVTLVAQIKWGMLGKCLVVGMTYGNNSITYSMFQGLVVCSVWI